MSVRRTGFTGWMPVGKSAAAAMLIFMLGCNSLVGDEMFPYATMAKSCAPWDGLAMDIRLSSRPLKCGDGDVVELTMYFWRELPLNDDRTFTLGEKTDWGGASYCKGGKQPCERATAGSIHIEKFTEGKGGEGTYEIVFRKLGRVRGKFNARWCQARTMCG